MKEASFLEKLLDGGGVEWKRLGEVTCWDKRFQSVEISLQPKTISFKHVLASKLKEININSGEVKLLSTGKFTGFTSKELAGSNLNFGEVITIPSGGSADIKYYSGYFVDSGNILCSSQDVSKFSLKYIYHFLLEQNEIIQNFYRGSALISSMKKIMWVLIIFFRIELEKQNPIMCRNQGILLSIAKEIF